MKNRDGSIASGYFEPGYSQGAGDVYSSGLKLVLGQVSKVHHVDDQSNQSKKFVEYDVVVRDAMGGISTIKNIPTAASLGGTNDYEEVVLEPCEFAFSGKLEPGNLFKNKNGTTVIVAYIDGSKDKPFILTSIQHPKRDGAKKSDGIRKKGEFRGIEWEINKDGEFTLTHKGPRSPDGKLKTSDKTLTVVRFDKAGNLTVTDKANNQLKLNNTDIKVEIQSDTKGVKLELDGKNDKVVTTTAGGLKTEMEGQSDKMTTTTAGGLKIEVDGAGDKVTITTAGGPKVTIEGSNKITLEAGATKIEIDGNSGKIKLDGSLVDVGTGASALAALGPQLVAWLTSHTHMGDGGLIPAPTSPPLVPPPVSLLSTSVKIKV
jgi:hypothetical protein